MKAPRRDIAQVIVAQHASGGSVKAAARHIAAYLLEEGRTAELASILRDVRVRRSRDGYVEVVATSAHELSTKVRANIEAEARRLYPKAKEIIITSRIQPDVVGGVKLNIVDRQLDLTTRAQLQKFKTLAVHGKENA